MFSQRDAPFFRFAYPDTLPPLDDLFVDYMLEEARKSVKSEIDSAAAMKAFLHFDRSPFLFKRWLADSILHPDMGVNKVVQKVYGDVATELGFNVLWIGLSSVQRVIARMVADGNKHFFGKEGKARYETLAGARISSKSALRAAVNRLVRRDIFERCDGNLRLGDPFDRSQGPRLQE